MSKRSVGNARVFEKARHVNSSAAGYILLPIEPTIRASDGGCRGTRSWRREGSFFTHMQATRREHSAIRRGSMLRTARAIRALRMPLRPPVPFVAVRPIVPRPRSMDQVPGMLSSNILGRTRCHRQRPPKPMVRPSCRQTYRTSSGSPLIQGGEPCSVLSLLSMSRKVQRRQVRGVEDFCVSRRNHYRLRHLL